MSLLGQARRTLMTATGFGAVFAHRDELLAERNRLSADLSKLHADHETLRQEHASFQRQLAVAGVLTGSPDAPMRNLAASINSSIHLPSATFFHIVDQRREQFLETKPTLADTLVAIKIINLLIAKHEYFRGSIATTARPVGFMLDPANQCHLGCPSCTNTYNREYSETNFNQWPRGLMSNDTFEKLIGETGPYAFTAHFYNNHEPLLNKQTPAFVRRAADMRIRTFISTNLSFRKIDAEAIVKSGLQDLMVAIDGVSQGVYERYRKGGNVEWVLNNVRAIVAAKEKLNSRTPALRWQYLTFEHNVHEVPEAIRLADEIGFNTFNLGTPNAVSEDDPTVTSVEYKGPAEHRAVTLRPWVPLVFNGDLEHYRDVIQTAIGESAVERWQEQTGGVEQENAKTKDRCDWLNLAVISDANGRIMSCCNADYKILGNLNLSNIATSGGNLMNSGDYRMARKFLFDPATAKAENIGVPDRQQVICARCPARPRPQIGLDAVAGYAVETSTLAHPDMKFLHDWSMHTSV
jgi:MoaA/NifB/PqqE/SkfB family radical SAM enzyme